MDEGLHFVLYLFCLTPFHKPKNLNQINNLLKIPTLITLVWYLPNLIKLVMYKNYFRSFKYSIANALEIKIQGDQLHWVILGFYNNIYTCIYIKQSIQINCRLTSSVPLPNSSTTTRDLAVASRSASDICN